VPQWPEDGSTGSQIPEYGIPIPKAPYEEKLEELQKEIAEMARSHAQLGTIRATLLVNQERGTLAGLDLTEDMTTLNMVIVLCERYAERLTAENMSARNGGE
jgi:hypothetical protein